MADAGATMPTIDVTPQIDPYAYEGTPAAIAANVGAQTPWWLYALVAIGLFLLWEE
jgi:hypothetical protein